MIGDHRNACEEYRAMMERAIAYRAAWMEGAGSRVKLLDDYFDLESRLPRGVSMDEVNPDLFQRGKTALAACDAYNQQIERFRRDLFELLSKALAAIGAHYGAAMAVDEGSLSDRFAKHWQAANLFRRDMLDGKFIDVDAFDQDGPMFKSFANAAGYLSRKHLVADLLKADAQDDMKRAACHAPT